MGRALQWPDPQLEVAGVGVPHPTLQLRQEVLLVGETPRRPTAESVQQMDRPPPSWVKQGSLTGQPSQAAPARIKQHAYQERGENTVFTARVDNKFQMQRNRERVQEHSLH